MITKEQWLNLVSKVDQTFEDEFKAEYNSPELIFPVVQRLLKQCSVSGSLPFSEVKSKILAGNAKSEYKQASIVMLRNIYSEAGAMTD